MFSFFNESVNSLLDLFEAENPKFHFVVINLIFFLMGYSPFLRSIGFWGSFYVFYHYGRRD